MRTGVPCNKGVGDVGTGPNSIEQNRKQRTPHMRTSLLVLHARRAFFATLRVRYLIAISKLITLIFFHYYSGRALYMTTAFRTDAQRLVCTTLGSACVTKADSPKTVSAMEADVATTFPTAPE